jgi:hypothetical protein
MLQSGANLGPELALEPLSRECIRYADEEDIVLFGEDLRVLEPGVVLRAREANLQLTEGSRPKLFEIQRLPFSASVQQQPLPTTINAYSMPATPKGIPRFRPPVSEARELYPKGMGGPLLLCSCAHIHVFDRLFLREKGLDL